MFETIVILVVALIVAAIFFNALQQHKAKVEAENRAELAKYKAIIDETENALMACSQFPISPRLILILQQRVLNALNSIHAIAPKTGDTKQRISDQEKMISESGLPSNDPSGDFALPETDKLIIQYIQGVKKLRVLLRSEHSKGKVDAKTYSEQDKHLERLQLKVNVETLGKRAAGALNTKMLGSARQYLEKGIKAMEAQARLDEFLAKRLMQFKQQLAQIQDELKNANAQDRKRKQEEERDELDELFAPKKKW